MTYIVKDPCVKCKYMDCVEVCPVDCFYEGENILVIHPDECIDCRVCEPECPVDAISDDSDESSKKWIDVNRKYAEKFGQILIKWGNHSMQRRLEGVEEKFKNHFSEKPGKGS